MRLRVHDRGARLLESGSNGLGPLRKLVGGDANADPDPAVRRGSRCASVQTTGIERPRRYPEKRYSAATSGVR